jgi:hypothetical protein
MNRWQKQGARAISIGIFTMILLVVALRMNEAQAGTKTYLGMSYGILDGCKATSFVGGEQFNEWLSIEGSAVIDSTSCRREGETIEISSMVGVHLNLSIPTTGSWYAEVSYGHTQLSRLGASSFGGSTFGFGAKYYLREAYSIKGMYTEIGDIAFVKFEGRINW